MRPTSGTGWAASRLAPEMEWGFPELWVLAHMRVTDLRNASLTVG